MSYVGYVKQDGVTVAKVFAESRERCKTEIEHYAWQYREEGPVTVIVRKCPERK